jgi:hypothetical protein
VSRGIKRWSEERIAELQAEGRGKGRLASYLPWVRITDFHSRGRTHFPYSARTGRNHELLSDGENQTFAMLEWKRSNLDIREQYPLDREISLEVAHEISVRHPYYPGTQVPFVMTLDFLVTSVVDGQEVLRAYSVKEQKELERPEVIERLEIERSFCAEMGIPYYLIIKERLPHSKVRNILWIRKAQLEPDAFEEYPGFFEEHQARMVHDIAATRFRGSLADYCTNYDGRCSVDAGTGMRVARMLLANRALAMDLNNPDPERAPLACFQISAAPGRLRSVGGA